MFSIKYDDDEGFKKNNRGGERYNHQHHCGAKLISSKAIHA